MIKVIAVDFGGVYFRFRLGKDEYLRQLAALTGKDPDLLWDALRANIVPYMLGQTAEEYWRLFCEATGAAIPFEEFDRLNRLEYFSAPNEEVIALVQRLREKYVVALTANQSAGLDDADKEFGIYRNFDILMSSHQVGLLKPTKEFFDLLCRKSGARPEEILLIDDTPRIVEGAGALGISTILFENAQQLKAELERRGIL